jgi:hypothetical protein
MTLEEAQGPPIEVWAENWLAVSVFEAIGTQWRVGTGGFVGLDYNVLYRKLDRMNLTASEYDDLEDCVRILEDAALETMRIQK